MRLLSAWELSDLVQTQPYPCISIYMDLGVTPAERRSAPARLQKLVREAESALEQSSAKETKPFLLEPLVSRAPGTLAKLPGNTRGVALFRSFHTAAIYPVDQAVRDYVAVTDSFHLKPLLPTIQGFDSYYAIVLNHRAIRLYRGNDQRVGVVATFPAPPELGSGLRTQSRFGKDRGAPRRKIAWRPVSYIPPSIRVKDFVRQAARGIQRALNGQHAPIVLIGSPLMRHLYRETGSDERLLSEEVSMTLGAHEEKTIHRLTWPIARREFSRRSELVSSAYKRLKETPLICSDLPRIAKEVLLGRVSDILVSRDDLIFGRFDRASGMIVPLSPATSMIGDDVLCDISQETMLRGGSAHLLSKQEMPTNAPAAAILRW